MFTDGVPNHTDPKLAKYKMELQKQALAEFGDTGKSSSKQTEDAPPLPTKEETKSEDPFFSSL